MFASTSNSIQASERHVAPNRARRDTCQRHRTARVTDRNFDSCRQRERAGRRESSLGTAPSDGVSRVHTGSPRANLIGREARARSGQDQAQWEADKITPPPWLRSRETRSLAERLWQIVGERHEVRIRLVEQVARRRAVRPGRGRTRFRLGIVPQAAVGENLADHRDSDVIGVNSLLIGVNSLLFTLDR